MEITIPSDVCYNDKFIKEARKASRKNKTFTSKLDILVNAARIDRNRDSFPLEMTSGCEGITVIEDRSLQIKSGKRTPGGGFRIVYAKHRGRIIMLSIYFKGNNQKLSTEERKTVCKYVKTIKEGTWNEIFHPLEAPSFEHLIEGKWF